ncbi:MAG: hypothetical protein AAGN66_01585 [Acidobacteriota bacterium]
MENRPKPSHGNPARSGTRRAPVSAVALAAGTVALVTLVGLVFFASRVSLSAALDRGLGGAPDPLAEERGADPLGDGPATAVAAEPPPAPKVAEPEAPAWTLLDVEAAVKQVGGDLEILVADGRSEVPEFRDMDSGKGTRAEVMRNRWTSWGTIWRNRVGVARGQMPPMDDCAIHAAMEPACATLFGILDSLEEVPAAETTEGASEQLDAVAERVELFLRPPPEPEEEEGEGDDGAEGAPDGETEETPDP